MKYFILALFGFQFYAIANLVKFDAGVIQGKNNDGRYFSLNTTYDYNKTHTLNGQYDQTQRIFNGDTTVRDEQLFLTHYYKRKKYYFESSATTSFLNKFYPQYSLAFTPHYIYQGFDLWAGGKIAKFEGETYLTIRFGVLKELPYDLQIGAQYFTTNSSPQANSYHLFGIKEFKRFLTRIDIASGKAVEDEDLIGSFDSLSLQCLYKIDQFAIGGKFINYNGSIREEQTYALVGQKSF